MLLKRLMFLKYQVNNYELWSIDHHLCTSPKQYLYFKNNPLIPRILG
jgi:hypothetical protein